jgi:DNA polymerase (family 10)
MLAALIGRTWYPCAPDVQTHRDSAMPSRSEPILLGTALEMARLANDALSRAGFGEALVVGEARRGLELIDELTMILGGPSSAQEVARVLARVNACSAVELAGMDTVRMCFEGGGPASVRLVPCRQLVEGLIRGTGSARHVRWLESLASRKGGLAAVCARARAEDEVYAALGVPYAPPELREGATRRVPELVGAVGGIFHVHTTWSDGTASIEEMARGSRSAGFGYVGISEHSKASHYAGGLDARRLRQQARAIALARRRVPGIELLHGVEVDVLEDGSLDLDDATLGSLDFVIASVHSHLEMTPAEMTARLVRAVSHPLVTILGHPTGRLLLGRRPYSFDLDAVADAATANGTYLEINGNRQRLDLGEELVRRAAARSARFAIGPDAHSPGGLRDADLGLAVARRAGLASSQVLNAGGAAEVIADLSERRRRARRALALH